MMRVLLAFPRTALNGAVLLALLCYAIPMVAAPDDRDPTAATLSDSSSTYRVELHAIGGFGVTRYPEPPSRYSSRRYFAGYNLNARLMWHPDHLLSVGLMSGYQVFSRENFSASEHIDLQSDLIMELSSIPIQLAFEVRPLDIRFGAGIGVYVLLSQLHEEGNITHSSDVAYGGSAWLGYAFKITDRLRVGPDLVIQVVSDRSIVNLSAMFTVQYDLLVY